MKYYRQYAKMRVMLDWKHRGYFHPMIFLFFTFSRLDMHTYYFLKIFVC